MSLKQPMKLRKKRKYFSLPQLFLLTPLLTSLFAGPSLFSPLYSAPPASTKPLMDQMDEDLYDENSSLHAGNAKLTEPAHLKSQVLQMPQDKASTLVAAIHQIQDPQKLKDHLKTPEGKLEWDIIEKFPNLSSAELQQILNEEKVHLPIYLKVKNIWPESKIGELRKLVLEKNISTQIFTIKQQVPQIGLSEAKEWARKKLPNILLKNLKKLPPADLAKLKSLKNNTFKNFSSNYVLDEVINRIKGFSLDEFIELIKIKPNIIHNNSYDISSVVQYFPNFTLHDYSQLAQKLDSLSPLIELNRRFPQMGLPEMLAAIPNSLSGLAKLYSHYPSRMPSTFSGLQELIQGGLDFDFAEKIILGTSYNSNFVSLKEILEFQKASFKEIPFLYSDQILASLQREGIKKKDFLTPDLLKKMRGGIFNKTSTSLGGFISAFPNQKFNDVAKFLSRGGDLLDATNILKVIPGANLEDILNYQLEEGYISHLEKMKKTWGMSNLPEATQFLQKGGNMCAASLLKETFPTIQMEDYFKFKEISQLPIGPALLKKEGFQFTFEEYMEFEQLGGDALKVYENRKDWKNFSFQQILSHLRTFNHGNSQTNSMSLTEFSTETLKLIPSMEINLNQLLSSQGQVGSNQLCLNSQELGQLIFKTLQPEYEKKAKELAQKIYRVPEQKGQEIAENLTDEDKLFIKRYTGNGVYNEMNRQFRCPKLDNDRDIEIWDLNLGLKRALIKLKSDKIQTYRGLGMAPGRAMKYTPGAIVSEGSFLSTSELEKTGYNWNKGFVYVIKGRSGVNVQNVSSYKSEKEFLFPPQTRFKVVSFKPSTKPGFTGPMVIELEEIE